MGRPKKDKFAALEEDFKDSVAAMGDEDVRRKVSAVALDLEALLQAKELDEDLREKQEAASDAGAIYRDGAKGARLRIAYCKRILEDRGKEAGDVEMSIKRKQS